MAPDLAGQAPRPLHALSLSEIPGTHKRISWGVFPLMNKDALYVRWNGGGGYGDPLDRDAGRVEGDVRASVVSVSAAKKLYGVVLDPQTLKVDTHATSALRAEMRHVRIHESRQVNA
ncbi:hypothetical protein D9M72_442740 [compost metagenome]